MENKELYTKEELELFKHIESQEFEPMGKRELKEQKKNWQTVAKNTIKKMTRKKPFNIRLFESDIDKLKAQALREGLPYQTYLASIIHQFATGFESKNRLDSRLKKETVKAFSIK